MIGNFLRAFDHLLTGIPEQFPWYVGLLLFTGIIITLRLGFVQVRRFWHAVQVTMGVFDDPEDEGDVTHFQALTVALSATVGVGNIAGVALAIHYGGPGAIFWMWVTAFCGMALKFSECTLALKYRVFDENGEVSGGPMYYISKGLNLRLVAGFFAMCAIFCSFGTGNMNQANTIASLFTRHHAWAGHICGLVVALLVGIVIIGGVKRIARVTERLAPLMASIYFLGAITIILLNVDRVPATIWSILHGAWAPESAFGGTAAGVFVFTLLHGVRRGIFSNEAGQGSAPIAHACARTDEPVREGSVALLEPFIDTLVICSMTALCILLTGVWSTRFEETVVPSSVTACQEVVGGVPRRITGTVEFREGRPVGFRLARHHATLEEVRASVGQTPFTGSLEVVGGAIQEPPEGLVITGKGLLNGAPMTARAFREGLAPLFPRGDLIVKICVMLFAISTMISWSYYGDRSTQYLFGARYVMAYRVVYLFFVYIGSVAALELVWLFGDIALSLMAIPNLFAILLLSGEVKRDADEYFAREHVPFGQ